MTFVSEGTICTAAGQRQEQQQSHGAARKEVSQRARKAADNRGSTKYDCNDLHPVIRRLSRRDCHHSAQGCEERATLGRLNKHHNHNPERVELTPHPGHPASCRNRSRRFWFTLFSPPRIGDRSSATARCAKNCTATSAGF